MKQCQWCVVLRRRYDENIQGAVLMPTEDAALTLRDEVLATDGGEDSEALAVDVFPIDLTSREGMLDITNALLHEDDTEDEDL